MDAEELMRVEVERIIHSARLRLEQCQLHAGMLEKKSRDAEGARAVVARIEDGIKALEEFRAIVFAEHRGPAQLHASRADLVLSLAERRAVGARGGGGLTKTQKASCG
jgi:hypothetical protein